MKKKILSLILIAVLVLSLAVTFTSCGSSEKIDGVSVSATLNRAEYSEGENLTSVSMYINASNTNSSLKVTSFQYKIYFLDSYGNVLTARNANFDNALDPGESTSFYVGYTNIDGSTYTDYDGSFSAPRIPGQISSVRVVPVHMNTEPIEGASSEGDDSEWGFWTWFWVVIAGILLILFLFCCIGAEGDTDAIVGGVVIFLAPALIILFVHFTFFF